MLRFLILFGLLMIKTSHTTIDARPHRILMDTDMNMDDIFALFYVLKQNRSEFNLQAITINTNGWSNAGHAVNHLYDILYMMDRDDIPVGVGGEGGILPNATILPSVGGYLPIIDQDMSTAGDCRYRQAIPMGSKGRLDVDTSYGIRKKFLPQGNRRYIPLEQPTAQQVMIDAISAGSTVVFIMGAHTNLAIFLMNNPHLKRNIEHIYVMGGAVRPNCRDSNGNTFSKSGECKYPGNLFPGSGNPYAEFNIFADPLAAYQVLHSGIPITIVPLDATNTIPIHESFFTAFEKNQNTYEAQYCFQSLKLAHDTWFDSKFHENFFMWDSFMAGVAISAMRNADSISGENEFAIIEYMNITVITSNEPYGTSDGSNPLFNGRAIPKFNLQKNGVHSGHVQTGMRDPFCFLHNGQGKCEDGYTKEVTGSEAVRVLVAREAKNNDNKNDSFLDKKFYKSFLDVMNNPRYAGRFNISTQFPHYKQISYSPGQKTRKMGKPVVFDMDMSPGDFLVLLYLLKLPVELIDLKGVLVSATGWANGGTIDVVYDVLHMMGRDDIPVGLGDEIATGQEEPSFHSSGNCKYRKAIPHGGGGFLDGDTLYGLARDLPRSPRRYTAENSVTFGAPRDTDHPELRQPSALDVWKSTISSMDTATKISLLTSGPLTNLAEIILLQNASFMIQDVHIVGGHTRHGNKTKGNLFTVSSNEYAEFNMFLDPMAAKVVLESDLDITLIPVEMQREVSSFKEMLDRLQHFNGTPEARFVQSLLSKLWKLQGMHQSYRHMDIFLGEVLGGVIFSGNRLNQRYGIMPIRVFATGNPSTDGEISVDEERGRRVKVLDNINPEAYYDHFARVLGDKRQSAVIASFDEQKRLWSSRP